MMNLSKPFSQSSEENKQVIFDAIQDLLIDKKTLLEIASGTGQHAIFFSQKLPALTWQTSDLKPALPGITQWLEEANLDNLRAPIYLDVSKHTWPIKKYDAVFSANSFHIMSRQNVIDFFNQVKNGLEPNALILIYGPFNYQDQFTSDSNARFDRWLKNQNPESGIKSFEWCNQLAEENGLSLLKDIEMPQNNRVLVWQFST